MTSFFTAYASARGRRSASHHSGPETRGRGSLAACLLASLVVIATGCNQSPSEAERGAADDNDSVVEAPSPRDVTQPAAGADGSADPAADAEQSGAADTSAESGSATTAPADPASGPAEGEPRGAETGSPDDTGDTDGASPSDEEAAEATGSEDGAGATASLVSSSGSRPEAELPDGTDGDSAMRRNPLRSPSEEDDPPKKRFFAKTGKHSGKDFDPIEANGRIFVDWPKPDLAIVLTGRQDGYMEPCGCAGLDRMKGGMSRRHSFFRNLRQTRDWTTIGLDAGGICKGFGRQAELKFQTIVAGMNTMGYDVIGFGTSDLKFPAAELVSVAASLNDQASPFLSANVGLFGFDAELTERWRLLEAAGRKIGVTAVLGDQGRKAINNPDIELKPAVDAIQEVLPAMKEKSDLLILLAHATMEESIALGKQFPEFDVVVTAGGAPEPPPKPETIEGTDTLLIEVGEKGMDTIVLGLYDDPDEPTRYQRVPLDSRFDESEEMHQLMLAYQHQLKELGFAGLGLRPVPHPRLESQGRFVGTHKCKDCHEQSYDIWKRSGHAKAYETLVELNPPRQFDPECISCHVIGWHPTQYFPYESGYLSLEETPKKIDVGCENCHGPGEFHVKAEMGGDLEAARKYQKAMVITKEESEKRQCMTCHDLDNSPDFDFETYWPEVEHYEATE